MKPKKAAALPKPSDDAKFRELVLYVSHRCASDDTFGATKLNKILFFSDFMAHRALGKSITGHSYQKLPFGPAPRRLIPVTREMEEQGLCTTELRKYFGRIQKRIVPCKSADLSLFSAEEIDLVNAVIEGLRDGNASEVSEFSHEFPGWKAARMQEDIPYTTVFVGAARQLTTAESDFGLRLAADRGLLCR